MRKLFPLICFLAFGLQCYAQNALRDNLNGVYYDPTLYMQRYDIEDGSPYLDLEFKPAKIGDRDKTYLIRFNAYEGSVEVWIKENKVIELSPTGDEFIKMLDGSNTEYEFTKFKNQDGKVEKSFLERVKSSTSYSLYKKETIKYFKKTKAEGYAPAKPARFERVTPQFYLRPPGEKSMPIYLPGSKKKFLAVFGPKNAAKAKALIKKERLNLTKQEDIAKVLDAIYGE